MYIRYIFSSFLFLFFLSSMVSFSYAQIPPFRLVVEPIVPLPYTQVKVKIEPLLGKPKEITWSINGENIKEFNNQNTIEVSVYGVGVPTTVSATGIVNNKYITIVEEIFPISVTVLIEGDTYTPPGFKGASLLSPQSPIKAVANIYYKSKNGRVYTEKDFSIKWSYGGVGRKPQLGENNYLYINYSVLDNSNNRYISIKITNRDLDIDRLVQFPFYFVAPEIVLYREHQIYGPIYGKTYGVNNKLGVKAIQLVLEPFYFDNESVEKNLLSYNWSINNEISTPKGRSILLDSNDNLFITLGVDILHKNSAYYLQSDRYETYFEF